MNTKAIGSKFEQLALNFLLNKGLKLICKNFTIKGGELDLIMQENNTIVFIEVRYRKNKNFGSALESVNYYKQQKLQNCAEAFLQKHNQSLENTACRFDVVAFEGNNQPIWIKNFIS